MAGSRYGGKRRGLHSRYNPWTPQEDQKLKDLVLKYNAKNWSKIAEFIEGRNGKSCRLRWVNQICDNIMRGPFTAEEDEIIIAAHALHGNKWTLIAKCLPGRTDNAIKNRWNSSLKKRAMENGSYVQPKDDESLNDISISNEESVSSESKESLREEVTQCNNEGSSDIFPQDDELIEKQLLESSQQLLAMDAAISAAATDFDRDGQIDLVGMPSNSQEDQFSGNTMRYRGYQYHNNSKSYSGDGISEDGPFHLTASSYPSLKGTSFYNGGDFEQVVHRALDTNFLNNKSKQDFMAQSDNFVNSIRQQLLDPQLGSPVYNLGMPSYNYKSNNCQASPVENLYDTPLHTYNKDFLDYGSPPLTRVGDINIKQPLSTRLRRSRVIENLHNQDVFGSSSCSFYMDGLYPEFKPIKRDLIDSKFDSSSMQHPHFGKLDKIFSCSFNENQGPLGLSRCASTKSSQSRTMENNFLGQQSIQEVKEQDKQLFEEIQLPFEIPFDECDKSVDLVNKIDFDSEENDIFGEDFMQQQNLDPNEYLSYL